MSERIEQRKYARIEASLACTVATAGDAFEAVVTNLSKSGAGIIGPEGAADVGELLTVMLERSEGLLTLALPARVVRIEPRGERALFGVAFEALPPDEESELSLLLQMLAHGRGQGRRAHPRVAARVEVNCRTEMIFRGFLNDLSRGGLSVKTLREVEPGQSMEVSFGVLGVPGLMQVAGVVVTCQKLEHGFRVGMHFMPLNDEELAHVNRALDVLLGLKLPAGEVLDD